MREAHADVLWTDRITGFSRGRYLRQAFWKLNGVLRCRPMLDRERPRARRPLTRTVFSSTLMPPGWMWLSSNTPSYAGVRDIPGKILSAGQARGLGTAVQLCWGDLMATLYFDWCGYERNRPQLIYLWMLEQLMDYCTAAQLCAARFAQGQVVLRHDPAREGTHRRLTRPHNEAGDRASAIRQYWSGCATLSNGTGTVASRELGTLEALPRHRYRELAVRNG